MDSMLLFSKAQGCLRVQREAGGFSFGAVPAFPPLKPGGRWPTGSVFAADAARDGAAGEANVSGVECAVHGFGSVKWVGLRPRIIG
jgi:hypothetical protein